MTIGQTKKAIQREIDQALTGFEREIEIPFPIRFQRDTILQPGTWVVGSGFMYRREEELVHA